MERPVACLALLVSVLLAPMQARAIPAQGAKSLSIGFPNGGNPHLEGGAGIWWMATTRLNVGFNGDLTHISGGPGYTLDLGPAVRYYLDFGKWVSPFIYGQAITKMKGGGDGDTAKSESSGDGGYDVDVIGGFGVEWFVVRHLSFAAYVGARVDLMLAEGQQREVHTFTSSVHAQLYF